MIVIDGKEINTLKEAAEWLRNAWYYEPYNIWYEDYGKEGAEHYSECICIEPVRGHEDAGSHTLWSLDAFARFIGVQV